MATIGNSPWFKDETVPLHEYPKEPYPIFGNDPKSMTEDDKLCAVDKFWAQEEARIVNWRSKHKKRWNNRTAM